MISNQGKDPNWVFDTKNGIRANEVWQDDKEIFKFQWVNDLLVIVLMQFCCKRVCRKGFAIITTWFKHEFKDLVI